MASLVRALERHRARSARIRLGKGGGTIVIEKADEPTVIKPDNRLLGGSCNRTPCQAPAATWVNASNGVHYCRPCAMEINRWAPLLAGRRLCEPLKPAEPRHCDDYIDDPAQPDCLRRFLAYNQLPAAAKHPSADEAYNAGMEEHLGCPMWRDPVPVLFADHDGRRVRVVMASRFGDVGITTNLDAEHGYSARVAIADLTNFGEAANG